MDYMETAVCSDQLSSIPIGHLVRAFWALPRIGCTYATGKKARDKQLHASNRLVDALLCEIMKSSSLLTGADWSILLKSLGKLRYAWNKKLSNQTLDDVMKCKSKFSLSELSDVMWGLLRMAIESSGSGDVTSEFLSDNRVYSIFKRADDLILHDPMALKHIRPTRLANLVYCVSYSRYPNRVELLKEIAPVIITSMSNFSIGEIATIFTGYTESHVVVPKLSKAVIRSFALKCFLLGCFMMQIERVDTQKCTKLGVLL